MRDVAHDARHEPAERTIDDRAIERRMPHAGADRELAVRARDPIKLGDAVDVDQMGRARQPKRHGGDQALSARQHPAIGGRDLGQHRDRLGHGLGRMILKWRRLHGAEGVRLGPIIGTMIYF